MIYLYHKDAGNTQLILTGDEHRYIFRVRRHKVNDTLYLRNLEDGFLHQYEVMFIDRHSATLEWKDREILDVEASKKLHIGWCIIDPKSIEKSLPALNEIGVDKITFIYCERSQKSFKIDKIRMDKILLNSSQQSGRSKLMMIDTAESLEVFLEKYPESKMLNFSKNNMDSHADISTIIIGCEGGFSADEIARMKPKNIVGFETPFVLKSESAASAVASKILL